MYKTNFNGMLPQGYHSDSGKTTSTSTLCARHQHWDSPMAELLLSDGKLVIISTANESKNFNIGCCSLYACLLPEQGQLRFSQQL